MIATLAGRRSKLEQKDSQRWAALQVKRLQRLLPHPLMCGLFLVALRPLAQVFDIHGKAGGRRMTWPAWPSVSRNTVRRISWRDTMWRSAVWSAFASSRPRRRAAAGMV